MPGRNEGRSILIRCAVGPHRVTLQPVQACTGDAVHLGKAPGKKEKCESVRVKGLPLPFRVGSELLSEKEVLSNQRGSLPDGRSFAKEDSRHPLKSC